MIGGPLSLFLPCLLITKFNLLPCVSRKVLVLLRVILDQRSRSFSLPDLSSIFHPTRMVIYFFPFVFILVFAPTEILLFDHSPHWSLCHLSLSAVKKQLESSIILSGPLSEICLTGLRKHTDTHLCLVSIWNVVLSHSQPYTQHLDFPSIFS